MRYKLRTRILLVAVSVIATLAACTVGPGPSETPARWWQDDVIPSASHSYRKSVYSVFEGSDVDVPDAGETLRPSLSIIRVSPHYPVAFSPMTLRVRGLVGSSKVVLAIRGTGFHLAERPLHTVRGGVAVFAVPQFFDARTGQSESAAVQLTLHQGKKASRPVSVVMRDLPSLSQLGTKLGEISHDYLNFLEISLGDQLGALEALQAAPGNQVDTTQAQADVQKELVDIIKARYDVDRITLDPSLSLPMASLRDGTPVNFNQQALSEMDRGLGQYLLNLKEAGMFKDVEALTIHEGRDKRPRVGVTTLLTLLTSSAGVLIAQHNFQEALAKNNLVNQTAEATEAVFSGLEAAGAIAVGVGLLPEEAVAAAGFGAAALVTWVGVTAYNVATNLYSLLNATSQSPTAVAETQTNMQQIAKDGLLKGLGQIADQVYSGSGPVIEEVVKDYWDGADATSTTSEIGQAGADSSNVFLGCGASSPPKQQASTCPATFDETTSVNGAVQVDGDLSGPNPETFTNGSGSADIYTSPYENVGPLMEIELSDGSTNYDVIADPSGGFELYMPSNTNCECLLNVIDPLSDDSLGQTYAPIATGGSTTPVNLPPVSASCDDNDFSSPDGDEPDCDGSGG